jgi:Glycosyl transferases group 1
MRDVWPLYRHKLWAAGNLIRCRLHQYGPARRFRKFEAAVHPLTWRRHDELLEWAEAQITAAPAREGAESYLSSDDPLVRQGWGLTQTTLRQFRNRCRRYEHLRIMVHVPPAEVSSAHSSLGANFIQSFRHLGLAARELGWYEETRKALDEFRPTVLLTVDHAGYLSQIDWEAVQAYRQCQVLRVGLNAALPEYGNTTLAGRLEWAQRQKVDFYYSFKSRQYVKERYGEILAKGYPIFHLEFGANPLTYFPVPGIKRDLSYVFLGSTNPDKWPRYYSYFAPIVRDYPGYIDGPWWKSISRFGSAETHRYLCARARVALNLHIPNQIAWASELNERTYNLAACGVPQLIDEPKLLSDRFSRDSFFVAATPAEYRASFERILDDPDEAQRRALQAQREVFARQTIFQRAESFIEELARSELFYPSKKSLPELVAAV